MAFSTYSGFRTTNYSPNKQTLTQFKQQEGALIDDDLKAKGDLKPELFIFGQITLGKDFPVDNNSGLFCEMNVEYDSDWELLSMAKLGQSQTAYQCSSNIWVWNHPFELYWEPKNRIYWPRFIFRVWKLNELNTNQIMAFGTLKLPKTSGYHQLEVSTWTQTGELASKGDQPQNLIHKAYEFYLQDQPRYVKKTFDSSIEQSLGLSSGKIVVETEVKNKTLKSILFVLDCDEKFQSP